jgi:hypothetical protein
LDARNAERNTTTSAPAPPTITTGAERIKNLLSEPSRLE